MYTDVYRYYIGTIHLYTSMYTDVYRYYIGTIHSVLPPNVSPPRTILFTNSALLGCLCKKNTRVKNTCFWLSVVYVHQEDEHISEGLSDKKKCRRLVNVVTRETLRLDRTRWQGIWNTIQEASTNKNHLFFKDLHASYNKNMSVYHKLQTKCYQYHWNIDVMTCWTLELVVTFLSRWSTRMQGLCR